MSRIDAALCRPQGRRPRRPRRPISLPAIPTPRPSRRCSTGLPGAGADLIELGMPFSDPMADGPAIQAASLRALKAGMTLAKTLDDACARFRTGDADDADRADGLLQSDLSLRRRRASSRDAKAAGVDGLIVVDLPPEEDDELCLPALDARASTSSGWPTPTTDDERLPVVLRNTSRLRLLCLDRRHHRHQVGRRGRASPRRWRGCSRHTGLPVAVGFGIKTPAQAAEVAASRRRGGGGLGAGRARRRRSSTTKGRAEAGTGRRGARRRRRAWPRACARPRRRNGSGGGVMNWLTNFVLPKIRAGRRQEGGAGQSLAQMPALRADAVPPRARGRISTSAATAAITCASPPSSAWRCCSTTGSYQRIELPQGARRSAASSATASATPTGSRRRRPRPAQPRRLRGRARHDRRRAAVVARLRFRLHGRLDGHGGGRGAASPRRGSRCCRRRALIVVPASGGARMQEGILSLMQMPRTTLAVEMVKERACPISCC